MQLESRVQLMDDSVNIHLQPYPIHNRPIRIGNTRDAIADQCFIHRRGIIIHLKPPCSGHAVRGFGGYVLNAIDIVRHKSTGTKQRRQQRRLIRIVAGAIQQSLIGPLQKSVIRNVFNLVSDKLKNQQRIVLQITGQLLDFRRRFIRGGEQLRGI